MAKRYRLYRRAASGLYYAELYTPEGVRLATRSTGTADYDDAVEVVRGWLRDGIPAAERKGAAATTPAELADLASVLAALERLPLSAADAERVLSVLEARELVARGRWRKTGPGAHVTIGVFAKALYDGDDTPYLKYMATRRRPLSANHLRHIRAALKAHIIPLCGGQLVADIDLPFLERLQDALLARPVAAKGKARKPSASVAPRTLSRRSVNYCIGVLRVISKWARKQGVPVDVGAFEALEPLAEAAPARRGILHPEELDALLWREPGPFAEPWARVFYIVAAVSGLRLGELQALRLGAFLERKTGSGQVFALVRVGASWDRTTFKTPKNGRERIAVIPPSAWAIVRPFLEGLGDDPERLVFEGDEAGRPASNGRCSYALRRALARIGIDEKTRRERRLSAHSFRYGVNSALVNAKLGAARVQSILGHVSGDAMTTRYYAAGDDWADVIQALEGPKKKAPRQAKPGR